MNDTASGAEMAALFGISTRTVTDLAASGIFVRVGRGRYDVQASVRNVYHHLREVAAGRGEKATDPLHEQKVRLVRLQAERAEREAEIAAGKFINADEAEREWASYLVAQRARLLAVPTEVLQELPHLSKHEVAVIDRTLRDAMDDASQVEAIDPAAEVAR